MICGCRTPLLHEPQPDAPSIVPTAMNSGTVHIRSPAQHDIVVSGWEPCKSSLRRLVFTSGSVAQEQLSAYVSSEIMHKKLHIWHRLCSPILTNFIRGYQNMYIFGFILCIVCSFYAGCLRSDHTGNVKTMHILYEIVDFAWKWRAFKWVART